MNKLQFLCKYKTQSHAYVFEWQHDSRNDASHKHHDSEYGEKACTFSEIHL